MLYQRLFGFPDSLDRPYSGLGKHVTKAPMETDRFLHTLFFKEILYDANINLVKLSHVLVQAQLCHYESVANLSLDSWVYFRLLVHMHDVCCNSYVPASSESLGARSSGSLCKHLQICSWAGNTEFYHGCGFIASSDAKLLFYRIPLNTPEVPTHREKGG